MPAHTAPPRPANRSRSNLTTTPGALADIEKGVPVDDAKALQWYLMAAEQGDAKGQANVAFMYGHGEGVPEDLVSAHMWYTLAARQGNETARRNRDIVEQRMTREQIAEAQGLSREWIETHPQDGGN